MATADEFEVVKEVQVNTAIVDQPEMKGAC